MSLFDNLKLPFIEPILKELTLDPDDLHNYHPIWKFIFLAVLFLQNYLMNEDWFSQTEITRTPRPLISLYYIIQLLKPSFLLLLEWHVSIVGNIVNHSKLLNCLDSSLISSIISKLMSVFQPAIQQIYLAVTKCKYLRTSWCRF